MQRRARRVSEQRARGPDSHSAFRMKSRLPMRSRGTQHHGASVSPSSHQAHGWRKPDRSNRGCSSGAPARDDPRCGVLAAQDHRGYPLRRGCLCRVGYRAILLGGYPQDWSSQIRMPLLQRAVAYRYGRPADGISIGVQRFDGSGLVVRKYSQGEIQSAGIEFKELSSRLQRYSCNYPNLIDM
jgi:hypothetical protein